MISVNSKDGTIIAYEQSGHGHPVILVTGALGVRYDPGLAERLSSHFTVINYDRRGRGGSGDTPPYAIQREVEDIGALIDAVGGSACLYGLSSGAVLALEAACKLPGKVRKLAMYEPPFIVDSSRPPIPDDYVQQLNKAIAAGRRGDAVEIFMTKAIGIPAEFVAHMRSAPVSEVWGDDPGAMRPPEWADMEAVAHTLAYDGMIMGDTMSGKPLPARKWATNTSPALVITGGNSEGFFPTGAKALVNGLPNAQHRILEGQDHAISPAALAPLLVEFFNG
jgi:pimeloyl-ACP methyl ester carboxylesterase